MTRFLQTAAVFLIIFSFNISYAHKISVFAWAEDNTVTVESKFSGGKKVNQGAVTVVNKKGTTVNTGKTNINGEYSFTLKKKEPVRITVDAGGGHKGYWDITREDIGVTEEKSDAVSDVKKETKTIEIKNAPGIKEIVDQVVRERLKPIHREIALLRESKEPGLRDIVGGVGYIFGFMGIFLYFKYGRKE